MNEKILIHACCAVCAAYPVKQLRDMGYEPIIYFYNPNIHPREEYLTRLNELINYSRKMSYELIVEEDDPEVWFNYVKGLEFEPERGKRCLKCFDLRLSKTAQKAVELGINKFTSTLLISPHKSREDLITTGELAAKKYNAEFMSIDFRKNDGYLRTMQIAKAENFYRQSYCGCRYSDYDKSIGKKNIDDAVSKIFPKLGG